MIKTALTEKVETELESLDRLQANLFYALSCYISRPQAVIAQEVVGHLRRLCQHPEIELLPIQNKLYRQMLFCWQARLLQISEHDIECFYQHCFGRKQD